MFYRRFKLFALIITGSLLIGSISLTGCLGAAFPPPTFSPPGYIEPSAPPTEVTVNQLFSEYIADEAAADAKYRGEKLLFHQLVVEEVAQNGTTFESGNVRFTMRDSLKWNIEPGFILNIEGTCSGISALENLPTVQVSYIESIEGDIGAARARVGSY